MNDTGPATSWTTESRSDFLDFLDSNQQGIFYCAISIIFVLLLIVFALAIAVCCLVNRHKRQRKYRLDGKENGEESDTGKKVEKHEMNDTDEIKKPQGVGEKDEELENFTEAMYATVDCPSADDPTKSRQKKESEEGQEKMVDLDSTVDACNYDVITHVEEDNMKGHSKPKKKREMVKDKKSCPSESLTVNKEVEYSVPNKVRKKNTASSEQLSVQAPPLSSHYSQIAPDNIKRKSTFGGQEKSPQTTVGRRSRTRSPSEEAPPLPPPFVDDEGCTTSGNPPSLQTDLKAALKDKKLSRNSGEIVCAVYGNVQQLQIYADDPEEISSGQELYMNVGK